MADVYKFKIEKIKLFSVRFDLKNDKDFKLNKRISISSALEIKYDFIDDKKTLRSFIKFDASGEKLPFTLNVEIGGSFIFDDIVENKKILDKIARINCAAILFPYLRETVADVLRRSGLPPLNLPPVNFVELYNSDSSTEK
jgi:preprotein translocase subunit SecB